MQRYAEPRAWGQVPSGLNSVSVQAQSLAAPRSTLPVCLCRVQRYAEAQALGQVPTEHLDTGVNPAVFEIAGHMVLKRAQDYEVGQGTHTAPFPASMDSQQMDSLHL